MSMIPPAGPAQPGTLAEAAAAAPIPAAFAQPPVSLERSEIPGGHATWWTPAELPPRKKRELDVAGVVFAPQLARAVDGGATVSNLASMTDDEKVRLGADLVTSEQDARDLFAMNDRVAWAYLKGWTLTDPVYGPPDPANGGAAPVTGTVPKPLPATPDDLLDLDRPLYNALLAHSAKIHVQAQLPGQGFQVDSAADPTSPTAASGA